MTIRSLPLRFLRRSWDTVALALALSILLVLTFSLTRIAAWTPRTVLLATLALVAVQLLREYRQIRDLATEGPPAQPPAKPVTTPIVAALWVAAIIPAVLLFGASLGSSLYCFAYLRRHARESRTASAALALVLGGSMEVVLGVLLGAQLDHGWLLKMLHQVIG